MLIISHSLLLLEGNSSRTGRKEQDTGVRGPMGHLGIPFERPGWVRRPRVSLSFGRGGGWRRVAAVKLIANFMLLCMVKIPHRSPLAPAPCTLSSNLRVFISFPALCPLPLKHTHTHTHAQIHAQRHTHTRFFFSNFKPHTTVREVSQRRRKKKAARERLRKLVQTSTCCQGNKPW